MALDSRKEPSLKTQICTLFLAFFSLTAQAVEIEYIPPAKRAELKSDFDKSTPIKEIEGKWSCEMFGVRSGLQVAHDVKLYDFKKLDSGYKNSGAHFVTSFSIKSGEFTGSARNMNEMIRRKSDGKLISRLTPEGTNDATVYSVCRQDGKTS
jgi:hypothetical protein